MDGNGRWARERGKQRHSGHRQGVKATRNIVESAAARGIGALTLFAFSSENWRRPEKEVSLLMELFLQTLKSEAKKLHKNNVRLRFIGDRAGFAEKLQKQIAAVEDMTAGNDGLQLNIAANYGGRWDIVNAGRSIAAAVRDNEIAVEDISEQTFESHLALAELPEPDLFIRTGGEKRISNFLLWQLAYTELYFTDILWPDFNDQEFSLSLEYFAGRQRRFGQTGEQVEQDSAHA